LLETSAQQFATPVLKPEPLQTPVNQAVAAQSEARVFVLDTAVVGITQFLLKFRGLIAIPLIVKLLGTSQYGIWVQTLALVDVSSSLVGLNLYHPLVRFLAEKPTRGKSIYSTLMTATVAASLLGGVVVYLFAGQISRLILGDSSYGWHIRAGSLLVLCYNVRLVNLNAYRAIGRLKERSLVELLSTAGLLLSIGLLLWNGFGLLSIFLFMGVWEGVLGLFLTARLGRIIGWGALEKGILLRALSYALPLLPAGLSILLLDRGDRLVIGYYLGSKAVGIYSANYALAGLLMLLQTPLQITLFPKVSALWETRRDSALRYISVSNKLFLTLAIPFAIGLPVIARGLLTRFGNEEIAAGSGVITFLVSAGVVLWGVSIMQAQIFYGARRTLAVGVVTMAAALMNLLLNFALVPVWGTSGAAFSTLVCYFLTCVVFYFSSRQTAKVEFYWLHLLKCIAASLLMATLLRLLTQAWPGAVIPAIIVGGLVYFALLWLLRAIAPAEMDLLRGLLRPPTPQRG
jgi:O-antigen/teichoic acid export membrane protein